MKIEESQKKQFVVLCLLLVLVLGFGVYRLVGIKASASPKSNKVATAADKSSEAASKEADPSIVQASVDDVHLRGGAERDPFEPQRGPAKTEVQPGARTQEHMKPGNLAGLNTIAPIMPITMSPITGMRATPVPATGRDLQSQADADAGKELKLTGVIEGETNLAIIRGSESARYIVQEGQVIDGKYFVESIDRQGIVLRFNGKKLVLHLGGNDSSEKGT